MNCYYFHIHTSIFKLFLISLFERVVVVAFQNVFMLKLMKIIFFLFLKNYF